MGDHEIRSFETLFESMVNSHEDPAKWWVEFLELALHKAEQMEAERSSKTAENKEPESDVLVRDYETLTWDETARELGLRRNTLFAMLRQYGILIDDTFVDSRTKQERWGPRHNLPYPEYESRGWFIVSHMWCSVDVAVTQAGLEGIKKRMKFAIELSSSKPVED